MGTTDTFVSRSTCRGTCKRCGFGPCGARQRTTVKVSVARARAIGAQSTIKTIGEILRGAGAAAPFIKSVIQDLRSKGK